MDLTQLEQQLESALASVIAEEDQLQQAIDAVKAVLPAVQVDPVWQAVQDALVAGGWTAPALSTTTTTLPPSA